MTLQEAKAQRDALLARPLDWSKLGDAIAVQQWKKDLKKFSTAKSLADIEQGLNRFKEYFK
jgi:hypothetical protein